MSPPLPSPRAQGRPFPEGSAHTLAGTCGTWGVSGDLGSVGTLGSSGDLHRGPGGWRGPEGQWGPGGRREPGSLQGRREGSTHSRDNVVEEKPGFKRPAGNARRAEGADATAGPSARGRGRAAKAREPWAPCGGARHLAVVRRRLGRRSRPRLRPASLLPTCTPPLRSHPPTCSPAHAVGGGGGRALTLQADGGPGGRLGGREVPGIAHVHVKHTYLGVLRAAWASWTLNAGGGDRHPPSDPSKH